MESKIEQIKVILYKFTETLECGYMGIRCDENQPGEDNYMKLAQQIDALYSQSDTTKAEPLIRADVLREVETEIKKILDSVEKYGETYEHLIRLLVIVRNLKQGKLEG